MPDLDDLVTQYAALYFEREQVLQEVVDGRTPTFDPQGGRLEFSEDLSFKAQVLAVESGGRWRWGWALEDKYDSDLLRLSDRIRARGVDLTAQILLDPEVPLDEVDRQALAIVSVGLSVADAYVEVRAANHVTHCLIRDPEFPRRALDANGIRAVFEHTLATRKLPSARDAYLAYLEHHKVTPKDIGEDLVGLTTDGQVLSAKFDARGGLIYVGVKTNPPAGFPLDRLEWRGDEAEVVLTLGSIDAAVLGRLLHSHGLNGQTFSLKGPRGRTLVVSPLPAKAHLSLSVDEKQLGLGLSRQATEHVLSILRPNCSEYRSPSLPGLTLEVVQSEIKDASGKVQRSVGWDPLPEPVWAIDPQDVAAISVRAGRSRQRTRRRIVIGLLLALLGFWPGLVALGSYKLRHVPYTIPPAYRAPNPGFAMALGAGLRLKYLGISGYEVTDGRTVILLDPVMTRPRLIEMLSGPLEVDESLHAGFRRADYIVVNHAHHDHALGVSALALKTNATIVGSQSVINLAISRGVPPEKTLLATPGDVLRLGTFTVDVRETRHSKVLGVDNPMSGLIPTDAGPLWFYEFENDGTRFYRLEANGTSLWFHPSSHFAPGEYDRPAGTLIMGIAGEGLTAAKARGAIAEVDPQWVLPTHYDNFFQPRSEGLAALPTIDLDEAMQILGDTGGSDGPRSYLLDYDQIVELPGD